MPHGVIEPFEMSISAAQQTGMAAVGAAALECLIRPWRLSAPVSWS
jgi:hypothetical protein